MRLGGFFRPMFLVRIIGVLVLVAVTDHQRNVSNCSIRWNG